MSALRVGLRWRKLTPVPLAAPLNPAYTPDEAGKIISPQSAPTLTLSLFRVLPLVRSALDLCSHQLTLEAGTRNLDCFSSTPAQPLILQDPALVPFRLPRSFECPSPKSFFGTMRSSSD